MVEMNVQPYVDEYDDIDDDDWIGANSVIIAGEKIGDGSMIASRSVVKNNIHKYSIATKYLLPFKNINSI